MKAPVTILTLLLLAGVPAGCSVPNDGGPDARPDYYNLGSCYNSGLGPGYSRDYSYGGRYVQGQSRQC
jgi:hypothetical protein